MVDTPAADLPSASATPDVSAASSASPASAPPVGDAATPAPAAVETPVVVAAPEPAPAAAGPTPPTSLIGAEPPKPAENKAPDPASVTPPAEDTEIKKEDGTQSAEPAPLPAYEAFTVPEGVTFQDDKLSAFTKELGEFQNLTKADQAEVQKFGQKLVDRHVAEVKSAIERMNEAYTANWEKQKSDWKDAFMKDPEIGGNRQETSVNAAVEFIRTHGGTDKQQQEFRELMNLTGIGNHPAMIRMLAKANMNMAEGKPLPASKPVSAPTSKVGKRYGGQS